MLKKKHRSVRPITASWMPELFFNVLRSKMSLWHWHLSQCSFCNVKWSQMRQVADVMLLFYAAYISSCNSENDSNRCTLCFSKNVPVRQWKNFENRSIFVKVAANDKKVRRLLRHSVYILSPKIIHVKTLICKFKKKHKNMFFSLL